MWGGEGAGLGPCQRSYVHTIQSRHGRADDACAKGRSRSRDRKLTAAKRDTRLLSHLALRPKGQSEAARAICAQFRQDDVAGIHHPSPARMFSRAEGFPVALGATVLGIEDIRLQSPVGGRAVGARTTARAAVPIVRRRLRRSFVRLGPTPNAR